MTKEELLESLQNLKAGYISSLNSLDMMQNWGKTQLEALYATKIGKYKIELLELQIALKAINKKIQFCHQQINRGDTPNFDAIEEKVSDMVKDAYNEVNVEKTKVAYGKAVLSNLASPEDSQQLRKIFRTVARVLHPDVNPNMSEEQMDIWHQIYNAYQTGDLDRLKALEIIYTDQISATKNTEKELTEEQILLQTASLKQGVIELEEKIKALEKEFPFNLAEQIRDDEWVEEQQNLIKKEIESFQQALKEKEEIYQLIKETYD